MSFNGKIIKVNLTNAKIDIEEKNEEFYRLYFGGHGIGLFYMLTEMKHNIDPLGPENMIIFAPGLLTGLRAPAVPRYVVLSKSPLTNVLGKSEAGGRWGAEFKKAGFDAIIITGSSPKPVYLFIKDGVVEIKDASHLWGKDTGATQESIRNELNDKRIQVAQIGPAGEMRVLYANIVNNLAHFNGRNGMGAVMGSKKLKAIAVRGTSNVSSYNSNKILEIFRWTSESTKVHPLSSMLHSDGTPVGIKTMNAQGGLPTRHFEFGYFDGADDLASDEYSLPPRGCFSCPIKCKRVVEFNDGVSFVDKKYGGPEYETLAALGSNCGISDLKTIIKANELCNRYTIDTISLGMTISFAMRCYEEGIINSADTDGLEITFGNEDVIIPLIEKIVRREGIGDLLADGSMLLSEKFGPESKKYLLVTNSQEVPMHDPRIKSGLGLQYVLSPCGADHWFSQHDPLFATADGPGVKEMGPLGLTKPIEPDDLSSAKVKMVYYTSLLNSAYDTLGVCIFGYVPRSLIPLNKLLEIFEAATGWSMSLWEILKVGERALAMSREFSFQQSSVYTEDILPEAFYGALKNGPYAGKETIQKKQFEKAVKDYYSMAGWINNGGVSEGKLTELGLEWLKNGN